MRVVVALGAVLFLGGVVAACLVWAGVSEAAGLAFVLGSLGLGIGFTVWIGQSGNWGVPGDEPAIWRHEH